MSYTYTDITPMYYCLFVHFAIIFIVFKLFMRAKTQRGVQVYLFILAIIYPIIIFGNKREAKKRNEKE